MSQPADEGYGPKLAFAFFLVALFWFAFALSVQLMRHLNLGPDLPSAHLEPP